jgi:uncharacterized protein with HEPN domain
MSADYKTYFRGMFEAIENITLYTQGMDETSFRADSQTVDAVLFNLYGIAEGLRHIPLGGVSYDAFNYIIDHEYHDTDLHVIWNLVETHLSELKRSLKHRFEILEINDANNATS